MRILVLPPTAVNGTVMFEVNVDVVFPKLLNSLDSKIPFWL